MLTHGRYLSSLTQLRSVAIGAESLISPIPWRLWHYGFGMLPRSLHLVCVSVTVQIPISSSNGCLIGDSSLACGQ